MKRSLPTIPRLSIRAAIGLLSAALLLAACSTTLEAEDYDTSCSQDSECVTILVGDMCDCSCNEGAINAAELAAYNADRGDIECNTQCGACPEASPAVCVGGTCQVQ